VFSPGLPYNDSTPRNRDRLRPELADIVMKEITHTSALAALTPEVI
jgi:hypothetical protein